MTNKFEELCSKYVSEDLMSATPQQPAKPVTITPQTTNQTQQQNPNMKDEELFNLLQQKMADEKFKQAFSQWLKTQQNATP